MLRPSPDRLDAQIRSLSHGQDQWLKIIMDELKDSRGTVQKLQVHFSKCCVYLKDIFDRVLWQSFN